MPQHMCGVQRTAFRSWLSLFAPCGTWDLNSGQQAWCQAPLPADPSPWPGVCFVVRSRRHLVGIFTGLCQLLFWKTSSCLVSLILQCGTYFEMVPHSGDHSRALCYTFQIRVGMVFVAVPAPAYAVTSAILLLLLPHVQCVPTSQSLHLLPHLLLMFFLPIFSPSSQLHSGLRKGHFLKEPILRSSSKWLLTLPISSWSFC